ncbi:unnamed protein product [Cyprideis torosa]|uniref:TRAF3-interacting protein 1 n=1 Tax=Cyprideis torosa TaxID=163714 RepID=A0A7R8W2X1_9CRUS|nr:unnamed protein product [Cyprideis torosa]CAG0882303.1 unnamed protein product [Cyprideis torosa]
MGEAVDAKVLKNTQDVLGKFVKKPPLTEKLLQKPPFRFLHDIVRVVVSETGYLQGLYTEEELNSENIKDKEKKVAFLQKLISAVSLSTGEKVSVKPSKIVAGHDASKTNELLQIIGRAVENQPDESYDEERQCKDDDGCLKGVACCRSQAEPLAEEVQLQEHGDDITGEADVSSKQKRQYGGMSLHLANGCTSLTLSVTITNEDASQFSEFFAVDSSDAVSKVLSGDNGGGSAVTNGDVKKRKTTPGDAPSKGGTKKSDKIIEEPAKKKTTGKTSGSAATEEKTRRPTKKPVTADKPKPEDKKPSTRTRDRSKDSGQKHSTTAGKTPTAGKTTTPKGKGTTVDKKKKDGADEKKKKGGKTVTKEKKDGADEKKKKGGKTVTKVGFRKSRGEEGWSGREEEERRKDGDEAEEKKDGADEKKKKGGKTVTKAPSEPEDPMIPMETDKILDREPEHNEEPVPNGFNEAEPDGPDESFFAAVASQLESTLEEKPDERPQGLEAEGPGGGEEEAPLAGTTTVTPQPPPLRGEEEEEEKELPPEQTNGFFDPEEERPDTVGARSRPMSTVPGATRPGSIRPPSSGTRPMSTVGEAKPLPMSPAPPSPQPAPHSPQPAPSRPLTAASRPRPRTGVKSARPPSARPAPPRVKERTEAIDSIGGPVGVENARPQTGHVANVIRAIEPPVAAAAEEEDDGFLVEERRQEDEMEQQLLSGDGGSSQAPGGAEGEHGILVSQILEAKNELEKSHGAAAPTSLGGVSIERDLMSDAARARDREMVFREVTKLTTTIQDVTRAANPLGKLMDYLQEDVDAMQRELEQWRLESKQYGQALKREQGTTEQSVEPLRALLSELELAVKDQLDKIAAVKNSILRNDEKIQRMLGHREKTGVRTGKAY